MAHNCRKGCFASQLSKYKLRHIIKGDFVCITKANKNRSNTQWIGMRGFLTLFVGGRISNCDLTENYLHFLL